MKANLIVCYRCYRNVESQSLLGKFVETLSFSARLWYGFDHAYLGMFVAAQNQLRFMILLIDVVSGHFLLFHAFGKNFVGSYLRRRFWDQSM